VNFGRPFGTLDVTQETAGFRPIAAQALLQFEISLHCQLAPIGRTLALRPVAQSSQFEPLRCPPRPKVLPFWSASHSRIAAMRGSRQSALFQNYRLLDEKIEFVPALQKPTRTLPGRY
jgi:hypothetical protein